MNFINNQHEDMPPGAAQSTPQPMVEKSIADALAARVAELEAVLRGYEKWEGDLVLSQEAWRGGMAALPTLTQPLFDALIELQTQRNKVLGGEK